MEYQSTACSNKPVQMSFYSPVAPHKTVNLFHLVAKHLLTMLWTLGITKVFDVLSSASSRSWKDCCRVTLKDDSIRPEEHAELSQRTWPAKKISSSSSSCSFWASVALAPAKAAGFSGLGHDSDAFSPRFSWRYPLSLCWMTSSKSSLCWQAFNMALKAGCWPSELPAHRSCKAVSQAVLGLLRS